MVFKYLERISPSIDRTAYPGIGLPGARAPLGLLQLGIGASGQPLGGWCASAGSRGCAWPTFASSAAQLLLNPPSTCFTSAFIFFLFFFFPWKKFLEDFQPFNGNRKMKTKRQLSSPCFCPVASHPYPAEGQPTPAAWAYRSCTALQLWGMLSAGDLDTATAARK